MSSLVALLVLALAGAPAHAEPPGPDRALLEKRLTVAESSQDWAGALAAAVELDAIAEGEHVEALYRVARFHALLGHREPACESLERLSQAGLFDVGRVRREEAFASLREDARTTRSSRPEAWTPSSWWTRCTTSRSAGRTRRSSGRVSRREAGWS